MSSLESYHVKIRRMIVLMVVVFIATAAQAQNLRTSYFMESAPYRLNLNPAMAPDRGFVLIPIVGNLNGSVHSDALGVDDVVDLLKNGDDDDYYITDDFFNKLKDRNKACVVSGTDLISVGWWRGESFLSLNIGVKADGYVCVPRELFSFMRDMKGLNSNDYSDYLREMGEAEMNLNAYTEIGFGYTRQINDRVSVGGRLKGLLGHGNLHVKVNHVTVKTNLEGVDPNLNWATVDPVELLCAEGTASIDADAFMESSVQGLDLFTNDDGYIDHAHFDTKNMGVAGLGAAVDVGVSCRLSDEFALSAAVTDLGFIRWSKSNTRVAHANTSDLTYNSEDPKNAEHFLGIVGSGDAINLHLLRLVPEDRPVSRTTTLTSTLVVGGEYMPMKDVLRLGALYTSHFAECGNENELTFSLNYHPKSLLDFSLSYSPIMCGGSSFGLAMKLGPLFVGSDYLFLGNRSKCCNALVGLSIPLSSRGDKGR